VFENGPNMAKISWVYPGDSPYSPMEWGEYNLLLDIRNLVLVVHPMKNGLIKWLFGE